MQLLCKPGTQSIQESSSFLVDVFAAANEVCSLSEANDRRALERSASDHVKVCWISVWFVGAVPFYDESGIPVGRYAKALSLPQLRRVRSSQLTECPVE